MLFSFVAGLTCFGQPNPTPVSVPAPVMVGSEEKLKILAAARDKFAEEEKNLEQDQKNKRRDLVKLQNDKRKEWRDRERKARKQYFSEHGSGPERRKYVQDFIARKKEFDAKEKQEWVDFRKTTKDARDALKASIQKRKDLIQSALDQNRRPEL
jgi:hypothetical protein